MYLSDMDPGFYQGRGQLRRPKFADTVTQTLTREASYLQRGSIVSPKGPESLDFQCLNTPSVPF